MTNTKWRSDPLPLQRNTHPLSQPFRPLPHPIDQKKGGATEVAEVGKANNGKAILFNAPMVCSILNGRKKMTRRTRGLEALHPDCVAARPHENGRDWLFHDQFDRVLKALRCPYGQVGSKLWVRETISLVEDLGDGYEDWMLGPFDRCVRYCADSQTSDYSIVPEEYEPPRNAKEQHHRENTPEHWREFGPIPAIFMPRWACRIELEVVGVRVEKLHAISEADAIAEGIAERKVSDNDSRWVNYLADPNGSKAHTTVSDSRDSFRSLWISVNGTRSWNANPFVWVIEFKRVKPRPTPLKRKSRQ